MHAEPAIQAAATRIDDSLLDDPRLTSVRRDDLRYGWARFGTARSLRGLLVRWKAQPRLRTDQREFVAALQRARSASLADDVREIGTILASRAYPTGKPDRAAEIFAARYGASEKAPTMPEIAAAFDCTRQRVWQVLDRLLAAREGGSLVSFPALAVLARLRQSAPTHADDLEKSAGLHPGAGHSFRSFRQLCEDVLGVEPDVQVLEEPGRSSLGGMPYHAEFLSCAGSQCRAGLAAHLPTIAGELLFAKRLTATRKECERLVDRTPGLRWLDRDAGWFTQDDITEHGFLHKRLREALCVAKRPVPAAHLLTSVISLPNLAHRHGERMVALPLAVFVEALRGWPGIVIDGRSQVSDTSGKTPEEFLPPAQLKIYRALAERGGVARKDVVLDAVEAAVRSTAVTHVSQTPWVHAIGAELYALMGWPISTDAILAAAGAAGPDDLVVVVPGGRGSVDGSGSELPATGAAPTPERAAAR